MLKVAGGVWSVGAQIFSWDPAPGCITTALLYPVLENLHSGESSNMIVLNPAFFPFVLQG